jgi:hypothetical protein
MLDERSIRRSRGGWLLPLLSLVLMVLSIWMHRLASTLHWKVGTLWLPPGTATAHPELQAQLVAALGAVERVMSHLAVAELVLWAAAPLLAVSALRFRPRWPAGTVVALWVGMTALSFAVIE